MLHVDRPMKIFGLPETLLLWRLLRTLPPMLLVEVPISHNLRVRENGQWVKCMN